jgi:heme oxygenase (biliverdin-producing, ferredoxin)
MFFGRQTKQVAEKLNLQKELEFYEWEGDLSQLQRNVRSRLNRVASVRPPLTEASYDLPFRSCDLRLSSSVRRFAETNVHAPALFCCQGWSRVEKDRCLGEMEKAFTCSVDLRRHMFPC